MADLCDKRGIRVLEKVIEKYPTDSRWVVNKAPLKKKGLKFSEEDYFFITIKEDLERLKKCTRIEPTW